jgi:hypothetical protein
MHGNPHAGVGPGGTWHVSPEEQRNVRIRIALVSAGISHSLEKSGIAKNSSILDAILCD